jgi:CheY-like chemotaxis protein
MASYVLVVDDDPTVSSLIAKVLADLGSETLVASNGVDAMCRYIDAGPENFCAAILDLNMPHINGLEMVAQLKQKNPNIVTILCTGFPDMLDSNNPASMGFQAIIAKPFSVTDFKTQFLRALMDA